MVKQIQNTIDLLDEDALLLAKICCVSFISPEKIIKQREMLCLKISKYND